LQERDAAVERWLIDEVVPLYDAMHENPGRGRSAQQVAEKLRTHHEMRTKNASRGA
jgi:antitoxin ParD1/3/4